MLEARGFGVMNVEVLSVVLFDGLLTSFRIFFLLLLYQLWHQIKIKTLLFARPNLGLRSEIGNLRFFRDIFVLWPLTLLFEFFCTFSYRFDDHFFDLLVFLHFDFYSQLLFEA